MLTGTFLITSYFLTFFETKLVAGRKLASSLRNIESKPLLA